MGGTSFRWTLLRLLTLPLIVTSKQASLNCQHAPQECSCLVTDKETQIHCPSRADGQAHIIYEDRSLNIRCNNFTFNIESLHLDMQNVSTLVITHCKHKPEDFINSLRFTSKLTEIEVTNGSWDDAHVNLLFDSIKNLTRITLTVNNLRTFPKLELPYLKRLDLSKNSIEELSEGIKSTSLVKLSLKNNRINYVTESLFEHSPKLDFIDLSNNNIVVLPPKLLHPLKNLKIIDLHSNDLREIPKDFFRNNSILEDVILTEANLKEMPEYVLPNRKHLKVLKFGQNRITSLPRNILLNMSELWNLDLSVNKLSNITNDTFKGLKQLRLLYLFHNKLKSWSRSYHQDLSNLEHLFLSNNLLTVIEANTFTGLGKLKKLDLGYNIISVIDETAFVGLARLTNLILYYNKLTTLDAIINVPIGEPNQNLVVRLHYNNISRIDVSNSTSWSVTKKLYLHGNPIICDCQFFTTLKYQKSKVDKSIVLSEEEKCVYPAKWNGTYIKYIGLHNFTCEDPSLYPCPENCNCQIHPLDGILEIDCSNAGFTRLPVIPNLNTMPSKFGIVLKSIWMNLTNNAIPELVENYSYKNVSVLDLSYNKLREMKWIPPGIEKLHLHNNEFSTIDKDVVRMLNESETLRKVTLDRNPWDCDCELVHFAQTLRTHMLPQISNHSIICYSGSHLLDLDEVACDFKEIYIVIIVIASILILTAITLIVLYVYFQDYVKLWLYKHKLFSWFLAEGDTEEDKQYDAFVSYSHKDEEFIIKHLLPELEKKEKYHLCLHERDWIVGELISKQIVDSVHNSRRTIIVLSKNFLDSDWANMEFKTAYSKSLVDKKNRLIIMLYEDIDLNTISNQELKVYLNTQTYVKWGDPWFWKKVKQAMPAKNFNRVREPKPNAGIKYAKASVKDAS